MPSKAQVSIVGHVGKDSEFRYTKSGQPVLTFSVATNKWQPGEDNDITTWWNIVMFGQRAESLHNHVDIRKGDAVTVFGEPYLDTWQGQDGNDRQTLKVVATEIMRLGGRGEGRKDTPNWGDASDQGAQAEGATGGEIPF